MKNNTKKYLSLALCAALVFSLAGTSAFARTRDFTEKRESCDVSTQSTADAVNASLESGTSLDETVYVLSGADGSVNKIIVSDWLKNADSQKGEDEYSQKTMEKELPVQLSVSYTLDGKAISPEELAGKSGHVTIRYDYQNLQYEEVQIDGKTEKIYVPFTMLTGVLLDTDVFHNVSVSNGKMVSDGDRLAVMGIAFPGLQEDLAIEKDKLEIPDFVEISADVENFKLGMTMTLATAELFGAVDSDEIDIHDLSDSMADLTEAIGQLMDGSSQLYDGLNTLLEKSEELAYGIDRLAAGGESLQAGAEALESGASQLQTGAAQLSEGLDTLNDNSSSLNNGASQVFSSLLSMANTQLAEAGLAVSELTIDNYAGVLDGVIASLDDTAVYQAAQAQVTAEVEAQREMIRGKVTEAVQAQVEAEVSSQVTAAVQEQISQAVRANEAQFRAAVIGQALSLSVEEYEAAVSAGLITGEQQEAVNAAVESAMQGEMDNRMQSEEIQAQIQSAMEQNLAEQMKGSEVQALIEENTELQVQQAISEAMSSEDVQAQLRAAAEGAQAVIALKSSLDSYNAFYLGLRSYTAGVSSAAEGAGQLKSGVDALKSGTSELSSGSDELLAGIQTIQDNSPALIEGITKLRDGSMELSDGLKRFNEEGIQKLVDVVDGDLEGLAERMRLTADAAASYTSFAGISENMDGVVKFLYKTESIG